MNVATKPTSFSNNDVEHLRRRVAELEAAEYQRSQTEAQLRAREHQQAIIAKLGQQVLEGISIEALLKKATVLISRTLNLDYCQIFELLPDQDLLLLRAGTGWSPQKIGSFTIEATPESLLGYTLFSSKPVIIEHLNTDHRFSISDSLAEMPFESGVNVIIDGEMWPFGVLSIFTNASRTFTDDDINFLQSAANILATAVEHKRTQQALQHAHDQLEQRVAERTADLETANEEIRTFAYIISHDLRAPLVNIKGFSGELDYSLNAVLDVIEGLMPTLNEAQQKTLKMALHEDIPEALAFINSSVGRMSDMINAVLKLSRLGRREMLFEPVDLNQLVHSTLASLAHQIEQKNVAVTVPPLPTIRADLTSMEQIFNNLLSNAVNYLDPNRPGQIEVATHRTRTHTVIDIADTGRGIAEDDMHKVFELFRRAGKQDVPGEGMGLSYVRTLVRRHGGQITCGSKLGVGTTFTITIAHNLGTGDATVG